MVDRCREDLLFVCLSEYLFHPQNNCACAVVRALQMGHFLPQYRLEPPTSLHPKTTTTILLCIHTCNVVFVRKITTFVITHYPSIWVNIDVKWLLLEQFELNETKILLASLPKIHVTCFVVVGFSGKDLPPIVV